MPSIAPSRMAKLPEPAMVKTEVTFLVKVKPNVTIQFFTFWVLKTVGRAVKSSNSPKVLAYV